MYDDSPCPRESVSGSEYCIFHHPQKTGELILRFKNALIDEKKIQKKLHPDFVDFTEFQFPEKIEFTNVLPKVSFIRSVFHEDVFFQSTDENKFIFKGFADFNNAIFKGNVSFSKAIFENNALFYDVIFEKPAQFILTTFKGFVSFARTTFKGDAGFVSTSFEKNVIFSNIKLEGIMRLIDFYLKLTMQIEISKWLKPESFTASIVLIKHPRCERDGRVVISGSMGEFKEFLAGYTFDCSDLTNIDFINEKWPMKEGRKALASEILFFKNASINTPEQIARTYRLLRENYENVKRFAEAGDFYIGEMEIQRQSRSKDMKWLLLTLYYYLSCYGENVKLSFIWSLLSIIFISELRWMIFIKPSNEEIISIWIAMLSPTLKAFFPFNKITLLRDVLTRLIGSILIGNMIVSIRRLLERK